MSENIINNDIMVTNIGDIDSPAEFDALGIDDEIKGLADFIYKTNTPETIAIQGDWGSGKTSIINGVKHYIKEKYNNDVLIIEFNAWEFSILNKDTSLPISLLEKIYFAISDTEQTKKFLSEIAIGIGNLGLKVFTKGDVKDVDELKRTINGSESQTYEKLKKDLKATAYKKLGIDENQIDKTNKRLLVIVDDLDRIDPIIAIEIMEVIQNFLKFKCCVFLLAIDYGVVTSGIKSKFKDINDSEKGTKFFEKIIQLPFQIPVDRYDIKNFIEKCIKKSYIDNSKAEKYATIVEFTVGKNPRSIKRIFNQMDLYSLIIKDFVGKKVLIQFLILCMQCSIKNSYNKISNVLYSNNKRDLFLKALNSMDVENKNEQDCYNFIANIIDSDETFNIFRELYGQSNITEVVDKTTDRIKSDENIQFYEKFHINYGEKILTKLNEKSKKYKKGGRTTGGIYSIASIENITEGYNFPICYSWDFIKSGNINNEYKIDVIINLYSTARLGVSDKKLENLSNDRRSDIEKMHKCLEGFKTENLEYIKQENKNGLKTHITFVVYENISTEKLNVEKISGLIEKTKNDLYVKLTK